MRGISLSFWVWVETRDEPVNKSISQVIGFGSSFHLNPENLLLNIT